ncbi:lysosomal acid lipase/cholesteryl ester hydrolase-like, partial [Tropilaelaps mercedesae]
MAAELMMRYMLQKNHIYNVAAIAYWSLEIAVASHEDDLGKTTVEMARDKGYKVEEHQIWTKDGYGITIHRIINESVSSSEGPPVIFGVPLFSESAGFVLQDKHNSMGYYCADQGLDVWLGNNRGSPFGRRHRTLRPQEDAFWDFSIIEHAIDLRAIVDYTLNFTGFPQTYYVGVSQGSVIATTLLSMVPSYNSRFALLAFFGAFRTTKHIAEYTQQIALYFKLFTGGSQKIQSGFKNGPVLTNSGGLSRFCHLAPRICGFLAESLNYRCVDKFRIDVMLEHFPTGTSVKNMAYYLQLSKPDAPRLFDYGSVENRRRYGNITHEVTGESGVPPPLKAELITAPIGLYFSHGDTVTPLKEFQDLRKGLPNIRYTYEITDQPTYGHVCYVTNRTNDAMYRNFTEEFKKIPIKKVN